MDDIDDRKPAAKLEDEDHIEADVDSKPVPAPAHVPVDPSLFFEHPAPMDVICGRGKSGPHPGNKRFRTFIADNKVADQQAKRREEKTRITQTILEELLTGPPASRYVRCCCQIFGLAPSPP